MGDDRSSAGLTEDEAAKRKAAGYVGQVVSGRYRVDGIVALGGMGAVFRAEHVHMRKQVALKVLHPSTQNLPALVTRFERESIVGAHVSHPNVCQATDFGQLEDGAHYLVLEYVEGRTLHDVLKEGRLAPDRAAVIAIQNAAGLAAAHALGIVHRDVKPANMILVEGPDVRVKIVDFGLAKLPARRFHIDDKIGVTRSGTVFGTVAYMAPELARGMIAVDHRSDLYALGIILYEMLAGKHPFDAAEPSALFRQHCKQPPPPIAERAPGAEVPPALEAVVRKLLEKDPRARYQTADELIEALDEACPPELGDEGATATTRPLPAPRPAAFRDRLPRIPPENRRRRATLRPRRRRPRPSRRASWLRRPPRGPGRAPDAGPRRRGPRRGGRRVDVFPRDPGQARRRGRRLVHRRVCRPREPQSLLGDGRPHRDGAARRDRVRDAARVSNPPGRFGERCSSGERGAGSIVARDRPPARPDERGGRHPRRQARRGLAAGARQGRARSLSRP